MQVSTSLASHLRQPTATPAAPRTAAASSFLVRSDSASAPGGTITSNNPFSLQVAGHHEQHRAHHAQAGRGGALGEGEVMPETDVNNVNQNVRRRLAALDRMVSNRLDGFVMRHADMQPGLADDVDVLSKEFHAALNDAYSAFRETGDRKELMHSVRGAFAEARSGFRFISSTVHAGEGGHPAGDPTITVDPGPVVEETPTGGSTTVAGAPGSGVTVAVTPLPETDLSSSAGASNPQDTLRGILDELVAKFGEMMSGLEDLIDNGFDSTQGEPSFKLAVNVYAEFQFGGSSLGDLFNSLS